MNKVIRFLEELGESSALRLDKVDFESILNNEEFDEETKKAILNEDPAALKMLMDARHKIVCILIPAEPDEEEDDDDSEEDDSQNDEKTSRIAML
ncbi:hypothetical protein FLL45_02695 [Aliikangiella marina]|uniref:Uncharacterized protein n=1 Tax=Aliikangiella marina TaxID=1712262 RepID=A0A545TI16_9GAMM|nr:hypothetical protein [Aliikangiella marina]TQV76879.1 hypothetical protein FLL45_02695 [Aliikangiella marina]